MLADFAELAMAQACVGFRVMRPLWERAKHCASSVAEQDTVKRSLTRWPNAPTVLLWLLRQPVLRAGTSSYTAKTLNAFSVSSRKPVPQVLTMEDFERNVKTAYIAS